MPIAAQSIVRRVVETLQDNTSVRWPVNELVRYLNDGQREPGAPTFGLEEGTSMAAPVVAGVVALLYSVKPTITFDQVYEVLKNSVTKFKPGGDCASATITRCGVGIVNAGNALEYLVTHG